MAPPRGRTTRRAGMHRIDAAFDALIPLGFSREVIKRTIQNLLEAYGGDEGWVFIEEASYKLLIDAILEQQEEEDQKQNNMEPEGENVEIHEQVDAGSTGQSAAIESGGVHSASVSGEEDGCEDGPPARGGYAPNLDLTSDGCEDGYPKLLSVTYKDTYPDNHSAVSGLVAPRWLEQNDEAPKRKRLPCYGWISESESDSESDE